jgi:hypothetical protein
MNEMKTGARVSILILSLLLSACSYEKMKGSPEDQTEAPAPQAEKGLPSFREVQDGVFLPRCQQCHERIGSELQFQNYDNVKSFLGEIKNRVFDRQDMPRGKKLNPEEMALLKTWLDQGGPL